MAFLVGLSLIQTGCSGSNTSGKATGFPCTLSPISASTTSGPLSARAQHVFIVMLENRAFEEVIGNTVDMPYLNALARNYAYAQGYFANTHPSVGNYFMLTTGRVISNHDEFASTVGADNIVRHLVSAGKTWKEYSENLPAVGYTGDDIDGYTEHHNPLSYFSDVRNNNTQRHNLVPFAELFVDLAAHRLPNYSFIVPSNKHNAHDCPDGGLICTKHQRMAAVDHWLQSNIAPLLQSSDFNTPGGGILVITFDESYESDSVMGGGHITWVVVGPDVKKGYVSTTCYQHESTLRFMSEVIGLSSFPGLATAAPDMREFLVGN
jgi:phosphatidylinositol-3-phosphatase